MQALEEGVEGSGLLIAACSGSQPGEALYLVLDPGSGHPSGRSNDVLKAGGETSREQYTPVLRAPEEWDLS